LVACPVLVNFENSAGKPGASLETRAVKNMIAALDQPAHRYDSIIGIAVEKVEIGEGSAVLIDAENGPGRTSATVSGHSVQRTIASFQQSADRLDAVSARECVQNGIAGAVLSDFEKGAGGVGVHIPGGTV